MEQKKMKCIMFYELCRLCLAEHGHCAIFERDGLSAEIYKCTGVKVSPSDNLPQKICEKCLDIVTKAIDLCIRAKRNECHLKSLFGDDENDVTKESEDPIEIVKSPYFQKHNHKAPKEKNSANEKFLKVRVDLFESSVAKLYKPSIQFTTYCDWLIKFMLHFNQSTRNDKYSGWKKRMGHGEKESTTSKETPPDSSKQPATQQTNSLDDGTLYEVCETFYIVEDAVSTDELSQPDSSQKPLSQKKIKCEDSNIKLECEICSKTFATQKKLYLHNRLHIKNFACPIDVCGKRFASRGDVEKHVRTHTGEKPFACDLCDKRFTQRVSLRTHKENMHSVG